MNINKTIGIAVSITLVLSIIVVISWMNASHQTGTLVIPAGNTYLGP